MLHHYKELYFDDYFKPYVCTTRWFEWSAVLSGCLKNSEYLTNNLKKPKRCIRGHEGNVENISRRRVFSGVFYHSVIHGLGFFLCFMIYAQNNKTRFFYVLHSDKTWVFTNQRACRALSMLSEAYHPGPGCSKPD